VSDTEVPGLEPAAFGSNLWMVDEVYQQFLEDPESVSEAWRAYFNGEAPSESTDPPSSAAETVPPAKPPVVEPVTPPAPQETAAPIQAEAPPKNALDTVLLRGAAAVVAERMEASRELPTATSVRNVPAKLLEVNRLIINNQLKRLTQGGKISFTHLIGYAVSRAFKELPHLNVAFAEIDGKPHLVRYPHVNLGLAIDVERKDGSRGLVVPNIKEADMLDFRSFWLKYEELVDKARSNRLTPDEFAGTTVTLTNPGTIGTVQSVPRLMPDQGVIVGVGAIAYPPEFQAADAGFIARQGIGRVLTLTSTYDHRVIQGAQSGELLARCSFDSLHAGTVGGRRQPADWESSLGRKAGQRFPVDQCLPGTRPPHC
jgi:2-oxoglutarate dehydrogenase E1 component